MSGLPREHGLVRSYIQAAIEHGVLPALARWNGRGDPGFEPLLTPGMHALTWADLYRMVVTAFPGSSIRRDLWEDLAQFVHQIGRLEVVSEFWLAGSFLSSKAAPADVDLVVVLQMEQVLSLHPGDAAQLEEILARANESSLDVAIMFEWDVVIRSHLQGLLGFCEDRTRARGIAVLPAAGTLTTPSPAPTAG